MSICACRGLALNSQKHRVSIDMGIQKYTPKYCHPDFRDPKKVPPICGKPATTSPLKAVTSLCMQPLEVHWCLKATCISASDLI